MVAAIALACGATLLGGCALRSGADATPGAAAQADAAAIQLSGSLTYRARIALAPQTSATVEVREGSSPDGALVARTQFDLQGRQVPVPLVMDIPAAALSGQRVLSLRAVFSLAGQPYWASEPRRLGGPAAAGNRSLELGELTMQPVRPQAFGATLQCGTRQATVATVVNEVVLRMEGRSLAMQALPTGSGVAYGAVDEPRTELRMKGESALLMLDGRALPECQVRALPMTTGDRLRERAELAANQLVGRVWTVHEINGAPVADGSRPTLSFDAAGRVSGSSGCNSYNAQYRLSGESIDISRAATTLRACAPAAGQTEGAFLAVLRDAQRVEVRGDGSLLIRADARRTLVAQAAR